MTAIVENKKIVGMKNFAEYLGVHYNTVYNWNKAGLLKCVRLKKTMIFDPEDYMKEQKTSPRKK